MKKTVILGFSCLAIACGNRTGSPASGTRDSAVVAATADTAGMEVRCFEGVLPAADCAGIRYELRLENKKISGNGNYRLKMVYLSAEDGKDVSFDSEGRWGTLRGTDDDPDATVYQLNIGDTTLEQINFLSYPDSLVLLGSDWKRPESKLNYTLRLVSSDGR